MAYYRARRSGVVAVGSLTGFAALAVTVHLRLWAGLDGLTMPAATLVSPCALMNAYAMLGGVFSAEVVGLLLVATAAVVWRRERSLVGAGLLVGGFLAASGLELAAKHAVSQPATWAVHPLSRPDCAGGLDYPLLQIRTPSTFPSGWAHRVEYLATLGWGAWKRRVGHPRRWALPVVVAGVIALQATRALGGWHWPSDVLGGVLLGDGAARLVAALRAGSGAGAARGAPGRVT